MTATLDLDALTLAKGAHDTRSQGVCLMEAVAWWAGKDHTDHPPCVANVLGIYGRNLNDVLPDSKRQALKPYIPQLPGTAGDGRDETRGYIALDWLIRTYTPAFLDLAGLTAEATALRDLRRIADLVAAQTAGPLVRDARDKAAAAWDAARAAAGAAAGDAAGAAAGAAAWAAAGDAARDAAWDAARAAAGAAAWAAARDAAGDAARAAARDAARAAARDAARAAAGAAARDAARDAAWDAARAAAGAAAWAAARDAAGDAAGDAARAAAGAAARDAARAAARAAARDAARAAARAAAGAALAPTVEALQDSAIGLYAALIAGEWPPEETS